MVLSYGQSRKRRSDLFLCGGSDHQPRSFANRSCQRERCGGSKLRVCPCLWTCRLLCESFHRNLHMEANDRPIRRHLSCCHPRHGKRNGRIELYPQFPDDREFRDRSASFHVMDFRGRTILSASSTFHEWTAWTRLSRMGLGRSDELGKSWHGNTHDLPFRLD